MTWIVGTPTVFGFALGVSDVRVTFADGSERDCLRKIYKVGDYIAMGFAGSVRIGFRMLERISTLLSQAGADQGWRPAVVAEWWERDAMDVFYDSPEDERRLGCELIMLGADPAEDVGIAGWARAYIFTFSSPRFQRLQVTGDQILSIGSGRRAQTYREAIERLRADENFEALVVTNRGIQIALAQAVRRTIGDNPLPGIGQAVHTCTVRRGAVDIAPFEMRFMGDDRSRDIVVPPVAQSYEEFRQMSRAAGVQAAAAAVC